MSLDPIFFICQNPFLKPEENSGTIKRSPSVKLGPSSIRKRRKNNFNQFFLPPNHFFETNPDLGQGAHRL